MTTVPYHLGPSDSFSLSYVAPEKARFQNHLTEYAPPTMVIPGRYTSLPTPVYLAYTSDPVSDSNSNPEIPDHPFVKTYLRVFAGVVDGRRAAGEDVSPSKSSALSTLPDLLSSRIQWKQSVPNVGGQLLSNLILTHALPNANHRTSLGMLLVYLQSIGVEATANDLHTAGVDTYIQDSKRLLTVRRNTTKFRILEECGCTHVERKGDIQIPLSNYDFTVADPYSAFAHKHERQSIEFVEQLLGEKWHGTEDSGLSTFLARLDS